MYRFCYVFDIRMYTCIHMFTRCLTNLVDTLRHIVGMYLNQMGYEVKLSVVID